MGQDATLAFSPTAIHSCTARPDGTGVRLGVAFLGLFGPNGPLPLHLTEYALERQRIRKDGSFLGFADLFHHRMLSLFYRAWASAQPVVSFDRPQEDRFGDYVASLCGLGQPSLQRRDAMADEAKRFFSGRLQCVAKSAEGLRAIIQTSLNLPVQVREFIGEWLPIAPEDRCRLGADPETGTLGETTVIGAFAFSCQHRFRLRIGPMDLDAYEGFLPGGTALIALVSLVRNFVGDEYAWDVQPVLRKEAVPPLRLGAPQARLGWTTWLGHRSQARDADDLILDPFFSPRQSPEDSDP